MSPEVPITGEVLRWARESAGYDIDQLAKKADVTAAQIGEWERGSSRPRYTQLKRIAAALKRPMAAFLLTKPPVEPSVPEFRTLQGASDELTPDARLAIRMVRRWQRIADELLEELGGQPVKVSHATLAADAEELARKVRKSLGIPADWPRSAQHATEAFAIARRAIEGTGTFVFQLKFPTKDARGFSFQHTRAPVICISKTDELVARTFSLFHEYAHLMLGEGGICVADPNHLTTGKDVEQFCNRFAAEVVLPKEMLLEELPEEEPAESRVRSAAKKLRLSKYVVARRLLTFGRISRKTHGAWIAAWRRVDDVPRDPDDDSGPRIPWPERYLTERGVHFFRLVLDAEARNVISRADVLNYLGVKAMHIEPMQELVIEDEDTARTA